MKKDFSQLKKDLNEFGIELTAEMEEQFLLYYNMLIEWNSFMNLTAITDFDEVLKKHFTDSVSLIRAIPDLGEKKFKVIDVGTGAGFPGIPLKIVFPNISVVLLDSLNKRVNFLKEVISKLQLTDITAMHGRAEDFAQNKEYRESFDLCVSRAVANLATLSEYCLPFVKKNGDLFPISQKRFQKNLRFRGKPFLFLAASMKIRLPLSFQILIFTEIFLS